MSNIEAESMPPPSFGSTMVAAAVPTALWCCFLPLSDLLWWLPASIFLSLCKDMVPESIPVESVLHLYAAYSAIADARWVSLWSILPGTLLLQKAMGLSHEAIWDALKPFVKPDHGTEVQHRRKPDMLDKDGKTLGPQTLLCPGTQIRLDNHDGRGFQPFIIPGEPTFPSERKAIEAFFTDEELDALKAARIKPWEDEAQQVLTPGRVVKLREEHGLWKSQK